MNIFKRLILAASAVAMIAMPLAASADAAVRLESTANVANVTAGDTTYQKSVGAKVDEVVKLQVWYHNMENADSGKVAKNLKMAIVLPTAAGKVQTLTSTVSADNANTVTDHATVNLSLDNAHLEYIPGSAKWRHNAGDNTNVNYVTTTLTSGQENALLNGGINLGDEQPCFNFESTMTVLVRVKASAVSITKQVRKLGEKTWVVTNTASQGDALEYLITFKNDGNTTLNNVIVGDNLPPHLTYVKGTTMLKNGANPNGIKITSDNVTTGGIDVGNYAPGAVGYVWFQVTVNKDFTNPGCTDLKNVGIVRPQGMNEIYNTAITTVCVAGTKTTPPPTTPPQQPLPQTGAEGAAAGMFGTGVLGYAVTVYRRSKRSLIDALKR